MLGKHEWMQNIRSVPKYPDKAAESEYTPYIINTFIQYAWCLYYAKLSLLQRSDPSNAVLRHELTIWHSCPISERKSGLVQFDFPGCNKHFHELQHKWSNSYIFQTSLHLISVKKVPPKHVLKNFLGCFTEEHLFKELSKSWLHMHEHHRAQWKRKWWLSVVERNCHRFGYLAL